MILTMMLLWSSRELYARHARKAGQALELTGMLILAMPGIVLATGFFLLFNTTVGLPESADGIVIFTNALMAIPYALFARGLREVSAAEAGLITLVEPILNPVWVVLVAHERPSVPTLVGGALLLAGVAIRYVPGKGGPSKHAQEHRLTRPIDIDRMSE